MPLRTDAVAGPFRVAATDAADVASAADDLARQAGPDPRLILFFSGTHLCVEALSARLSERFPAAQVVGCTTAGELSPAGATRGTVSAIALGAPARAAAVLVDLDDFHFRSGRDVLDRLAGAIGETLESLVRERHVLLALTDGLSGGGELLAASLGAHAPHLAMVGGAAADGEAYHRTVVAVGGRSSGRGAAIVLLDPGIPFLPFATHHFRPTERRVVVTGAEPQRRLVHELDGWPAAHRLTELMGVPRDELPAEIQRRSACLGFAHGGDWYMRAVMRLEGDSLLMGGAVAVGTVLRWMEPGDIVAETTAAIARATGGLPTPPAGLLLFHCMGRSRTATSLGLRASLVEAMCGTHRVAGFDTYGEHLGPFLVNETLTGLAFGEPA